MLDSFLEEIEPPKLLRRSGGGRRTNNKHAGRFLLSVVLASRLMKNPGDLQILLHEKLLGLLPTGLRSEMREVFVGGSVQLPAWDSRLVLLADVALMLYRRQHVSNKPGRAQGMLRDSAGTI